MNRNIILMVIVASCLFMENAICADWKFYGEFTTAPDISEALFYDADSIIHTNNSIKLLVKSVLYSDLEKSLENKSIRENATNKIAKGYIPPITKIYSNVANVAYIEEAANDFSIKSKSEILYQIMCDENKYRKIAGAVYNNDGIPNQTFGITKWDDFAPKSNAENLTSILCGIKK